jgi:creatinine amidohydrolase/Fe(II)-dependent formamide hydrolase-like protein
MLDENLMRAELSPAERAKATARRKAVYLKLHPETANGATGAGRPKVRQFGEAGPAERFTAETAGTTGRSERAVQRDNERGEKVTDAALEKVVGTPLDSGAYLDWL